MNSAIQRIKSDPNLLIPYVLAIFSGGILIVLILWSVLSADAGLPPIVTNDSQAAIVVLTRTPVIIPTPTPEQELPRPFILGDSLLPRPDVGAALPDDQQDGGLDIGPTPDVDEENYENRVALPAPDSPDVNLQPTVPLANAQVDTGDTAQGGIQPGFPLANPDQEPLVPGGGTSLAPLPTPDIGNQGDLNPLPTPLDTSQPEPEPSLTPFGSLGQATVEPTPLPLGDSPLSTVEPTATPPPQSTVPVIPPLEEVIFLPDTSKLVSDALNAGEPLPLDFNDAAGVTPGTTRIAAEVYLVEDPGLSISGYRSALRAGGWLLLADTGELGPLIYYMDDFIFLVAGLESTQMAELGEERGPGVVLILYDPS